MWNQRPGIQPGPLSRLCVPLCVDTGGKAFPETLCVK